ncbi:MAG: aldo/keto reductase [Clostridia bacterium]
MSDYLGSDIKNLGFGFMRLPMKGEELDKEQVNSMVDHFMSNGFTYFDTAYVYHGGKSEGYLKEALVERYPRESFQVATKLPFWGIETAEKLPEMFEESLNRMGVEYFDFYLIHCINRGLIEKIDEYGAWELIKEKKAEGKIKHIGFSFHDNAEFLDELLTKHPEVEFVQLQINYIDWESENVQSRLCYEVAQKHGKPVIIMEPIKGGTLAAVTPKADKIFKDYSPEMSTASWAIRYAASLDNVITVLSGMSTMEQVEDNVSYMKDFKKLSDEEQDCIEKAVTVINNIPTIPCTGCNYCVEGCPMDINISRLFGVFNNHKKFGADANKPTNNFQFEQATKDKAKPSECIACGACQSHCPQNIEIIDELAKIASLYEN